MKPIRSLAAVLHAVGHGGALLALSVSQSCVPMTTNYGSSEALLSEMAVRVLALELQSMAATERGQVLMAREGANLYLPLDGVRPAADALREWLVLVPVDSAWDGPRLALARPRVDDRAVEMVAETFLVRFEHPAQGAEGVQFLRVPDGTYDLIGQWTFEYQSNGLRKRNVLKHSRVIVSDGGWSPPRMEQVTRSDILDRFALRIE